MKLSFHIKGHLLHCIDVEQIVDDIVIGRDPACSWPVPHEESLVSSRHARVYRKGKEVFIEDLKSRNGMLYRGRRITKKKLEPGDSITFGNCTLAVDGQSSVKVDGDNPGDRASYLFGLTKEWEGKKKEIRPPLLKIGTGEDQELILQDMLASRNHAEIAVRDNGDHWLKDVGSRNGTTVNGMKLPSGQERLLKDGDLVVIANYEFRYYDGAVVRVDPTKMRWLKWSVFGIALLLLGYLLLPSNLYKHLEMAETALSNRDLGSAEDCLKEARSHQLQGDAKIRYDRIDQAVRVGMTWKRLEKKLGEPEIRIANVKKELDNLKEILDEAKDKDSVWQWDPKGEKKEIASALLRIMNLDNETKRINDQLVETSWGSKLQQSDDPLAEDQEKLAGEFKGHLEKLGVADVVVSPSGELLFTGKEESASLLIKDQKWQKETRALVAEFVAHQAWQRKWQKVLIRLRDDKNVFSLKDTCQEMQNIIDKDPDNSAVKEAMKVICEETKGLKERSLALLNAVTSARACDFNDARVEVEKALKAIGNPEPGPWLLPISETMKGNGEALREAFDKNMKNPILTNFLWWKDYQELATEWQKIDQNGLLSCDFLTGKNGKAKAEYERLLGLKEFYRFLASLDQRDPYGEYVAINGNASGPVLAELRRMTLLSSAFLKEWEEQKWIMGGEFKTRFDSIRKTSQALDRNAEQWWKYGLASELSEDKALRRGAVLAGGIALLLNVDKDFFDKDQKKLSRLEAERKLAALVKVLESKTKDDYREGKKEDILSVGLPGNQYVEEALSSLKENIP